MDWTRMLKLARSLDTAMARAFERALAGKGVFYVQARPDIPDRYAGMRECMENRGSPMNLR